MARLSLLALALALLLAVLLLTAGVRMPQSIASPEPHSLADLFAVTTDKSLTPLTVTEIASPARTLQWQPPTGKTANYGFAKTNAWYRATLSQTMFSQLKTEWFLVSRLWVLNFRVYARVPGEADFFEIPREFLSDEERARKLARNWIFRLPFERAQTLEVYVNIRSAGSEHHMALLSSEQLQLHLITEEGAWGLFFGILIAMAIYNFFIYTLEHSVAYLYFAVCLLLACLTSGAFFGVQLSPWWPDGLQIDRGKVNSVAVLAMAAFAIFSDKFLELARLQGRLWRWLRMGFWVVCSTLVLSALLIIGGLEWNQGIMTAVLCGLVVLTLVPLIGGRLRQGGRAAVYFCVSFAGLAVGVFGFILKQLTLLDVNTFTTHGIEFGSLWMAMTFSFSLADRLNEQKKSHAIAEAQALQARQHALLAEKHHLRRLVALAIHLSDRLNSPVLAAVNAIDRIRREGGRHGLRGAEKNRTEKLMAILSDSIHSIHATVADLEALREQADQESTEILRSTPDESAIAYEKRQDVANS